ncbi:MAG: peptidase and in kexin sedolisin [Pedosphaera sp.]|nr:peptidase and in kexin sedolisin [Pedosphaera sp.]
MQTKYYDMKFITIFTSAMLLAAVTAPGQTFQFTNAVNQAVPDGNPTGVRSTIDVSGVTGQTLNLDVSLNLSGGYNGDLYVSLTGPTGIYSVLLNRVGVSGSDSFGYGNTGLNITLSDHLGASNIHWYQNAGYTLNGSGQLIGTWSADGLALNLQASPSAADGATPTAGLGSFDGSDANGTWTLFLADLAGGEQSTLVGWSLQVAAVPEPASGSLLLLGAAAMAGVTWRRRASRR